MKFVRKAVVPLLVLMGGGVGLLLLTLSRGEAEVVSDVEVPISIEVGRVKREALRESVRFSGRVRPRAEIRLMPEVSGRIVAVNPSLQLGGMIKKGEELFRIEERDFALGLEEASAGLSFEESQLQVEMGRARVAGQSVEMYRNGEYEGSTDYSLALRRPQVEQQEAVVRMHESRVAKAALDLTRCRVVAASDYTVLDERIDLGQYVEAGEDLGRLAVGGSFEVVARAPFSLFGGMLEKMGNLRSLRASIEGYELVGKVENPLADIDPVTNRSGFLLTFEGWDENRRPLFGSLVEGHIVGAPPRFFPVVPEECLGAGGRIWVLDAEGIVNSRVVEVAAFRGGLAFVEKGLDVGEQVVLRHEGLLRDGVVAERVKSVDWR